MVSSLLLQLAILSLVVVPDTTGHGALIEPPMRSVLWKYGFDAPINYNYAELYCGGFQRYLENNGRCGVCGDPLQGPYENESGGKYDLGIIARSYPEGTTNIEVKVEITAHHKGYFEFKLCPNNEAEVTQECLDRFPLMIEEGVQQGDPMKFYPPYGENVHPLKVIVPPDMRCERCVLQWTYNTGNRWGKDPDGKNCLGCGMQERFINCADISIKNRGPLVNARLNSTDNVAASDHTPRPQINANLSQIQTSVPSMTQGTNKMPNSDRRGQSMGRHQPVPGISNNNAHLFALNRTANTVREEAMGRHQPQGIRQEVQAMMALASPQLREFYPILMKILSNSQQNKNLQNDWKERDRTMFAALKSLHSAISNGAHKEALIRDITQSKR